MFFTILVVIAVTRCGLIGERCECGWIGDTDDTASMLTRHRPCRVIFEIVAVDDIARDGARRVE